MTSAPGWYPDPDAKGGMRYFDGQQWTEHRAAPTPAPAPTTVATPRPPGSPSSKTMMIGIAVVALFLCLIVGTVISDKYNKKANDSASSGGSTAPSTLTPTIGDTPTVAPTSTIAAPAPTTSRGSVPFVGNPKCGEEHDPSDESGTGGPPGSYLCAEKNYLHKLADDNVVIDDPVAAISAGYDHVCAIVGPSDLDTPNLGEREEKAKAEVLASAVVTTPDDAQHVVSDAVIELC